MFKSVELTPMNLIGAIFVAGLLSINIVSFFGAAAVIPLFFYMWIAVAANFLPIVILVLVAVQRELARDLAKGLTVYWLYWTIMWVGCAHGLSRWGDLEPLNSVNMPYTEVLFQPWIYLKASIFPKEEPQVE